MSFGYQVLGFGSGAAGGLTATGGTITDYAGYKVHTFSGNGTFEITAGSGEIDVLIVAGGGGGGSEHAGGGGAGGLIEMPLQEVGVASYAIVIGAGGGTQTAGDDTTGFGQTCSGGGLGGRYTSPAPSTGGCGGGGGGVPQSGAGTDQTTVQSPWTGTAYGTAGGAGAMGGGCHGGGGGGGTGGAGTAAASCSSAGPGGPGRQNLYATGVNQYYAAGGGGGVWSGSTGAGGTGGGGAGSESNSLAVAPSGTTYGSGGGGNGGQSRTGGSGYQGVTVIRYPG